MQYSEESNRRPLAVRNIAITKYIAVWLSRKSITPNQISLMSMAFAALGLAFATSYYFWPTPIWLGLFAVAIQLRLFCNLLDGMVAIEGGKKTPAGELFNDVPDRISDPLLIVAAGLVTYSTFGLLMAWGAALLAVLTAYIRVLGVSMDCPADFRGPMAKQHRMALLTITLLIMFFAQLFELSSSFSCYLMDIALVIIIFGSACTCWRRLLFIFKTKVQQAARQSCHQVSDKESSEGLVASETAIAKEASHD